MQAHRNEIARLMKLMDTLQSQTQKSHEYVVCIQQHWLLLVDELRRTFQRLEARKSASENISIGVLSLLQSQVVCVSIF